MNTGLYIYNSPHPATQIILSSIKFCPSSIISKPVSVFLYALSFSNNSQISYMHLTLSPEKTMRNMMVLFNQIIALNYTFIYLYI